MKSVFSILVLLISLKNIAQNPPPIHVPGTTAKVEYAAGSFKSNTSFLKDQRNYSNDKRYCLSFNPMAIL